MVLVHRSPTWPKENTPSNSARLRETLSGNVVGVAARGEVANDLQSWHDTPVRESNGGRTLHGFNLIGINGRPLVKFNYETEEEAAATREQMRQAVARAKTIIPHQA